LGAQHITTTSVRLKGGAEGCRDRNHNRTNKTEGGENGGKRGGARIGNMTNRAFEG